jgi:rhamnogalacturonan endolyase
MWSSSSGGVYDRTGARISTFTPSYNFAAWWDADLQRELVDKAGKDGNPKLEKWNGNGVDRVLSFYNYPTDYGCNSINGTKGNPCLSGDILGDWREEVIYRLTDNTGLIVFTTTIPANNRFYTFMHDPQYRLSIAWQNVAYNQPPHTSFYIGEGMAEPPHPQIKVLYGDLTGDNIVDIDDISKFSESWLATDCNNVELDWNGDCIINFYEFSLLARELFDEIQ